MKTWQETASGSVLAGQAGKLGIIQQASGRCALPRTQAGHLGAGDSVKDSVCLPNFRSSRVGEMSGEWNTSNDLYPGAFLQNAMQQLEAVFQAVLWEGSGDLAYGSIFNKWGHGVFICTLGAALPPKQGRTSLHFSDPAVHQLPVSLHLSILLLWYKAVEKRNKRKKPNGWRKHFLFTSLQIVIFFISKEKTDQQTLSIQSREYYLVID